MYRAIGSDLSRASERYSTSPHCFSCIMRVKNLKGTIDRNSIVLLEKKFHYFSTHFIRTEKNSICCCACILQISRRLRIDFKR